MRSVVVTLGPPLAQPWWWEEIQADPNLCPLAFHRVVFRNKTARQITGMELAMFLLAMLPTYLRLRRQFDYLFTFECDLTTFAVSFWQTLLRHDRPRHVVLQFIMREKTQALSSRLKYAAMRICFSSIHKVICSASGEADYYRNVFGWPPTRAAFVPFHTSGRLLLPGHISDDGFILSAGRSFRDFPTLLAALAPTSHRAVIVGPGEIVAPDDARGQIEVLGELSLADLDALLRRASVVVVSLQDTPLSAGQLVMLHAMALGKAVIVTKTVGTRDYIVDGENGILVPPGDAVALRTAIDFVMSNSQFRANLGIHARESVMARHLPHHYTQAVRSVLQG